MKNGIIYSLGIIDTEPREAFCSALPAAFIERRIGRSDQFHFANSELGLAADLHRRTREAGLDAFYTGDWGWSASDFAEGRIYLLNPPLIEGDFIRKEDVLSRQRCSLCTNVQDKLRHNAEVRLTIEAAELPPVFATAWGRAVCIELQFLNELESAGMTRGALAIPAEVTGPTTRAYLLLASSIDLGMPAGDQYLRRCSACDAPLTGGGYFAMFRHPDVDGDIFYSRSIGQTAPIVTGRLARVISRKLGRPDDAPLNFLGWYPEDQEEVRLPDLDQVPETAPSPRRP